MPLSARPRVFASSVSDKTELTCLLEVRPGTGMSLVQAGFLHFSLSDDAGVDDLPVKQNMQYLDSGPVLQSSKAVRYLGISYITPFHKSYLTLTVHPCLMTRPLCCTLLGPQSVAAWQVVPFSNRSSHELKIPVSNGRATVVLVMYIHQASGGGPDPKAHIIAHGLMNEAGWSLDVSALQPEP